MPTISRVVPEPVYSMGTLFFVKLPLLLASPAQALWCINDHFIILPIMVVREIRTDVFLFFKMNVFVQLALPLCILLLTYKKIFESNIFILGICRLF